MRDLRPRLAEATSAPVHVTWSLRMDPQVARIHGSPAWVVDRYGRELAELRAAGDCLGLHPHAWRWQDPPGRWLADHGDSAWIEETARFSFRTYTETFGEPCVTHRFGDRFMSPQLLQVLRELGVRYDLTIEPGARPIRTAHSGAAATGRIPDYAAAPREPYRPSPDYPMRSMPEPSALGGPHLWMIPNTSFDGDSLMPRWRRLARRVRDRGRPRHRPMSLARPSDPGAFWRLARAHLDACMKPYLCFALRSDVTIRPALWQAVIGKLDALVEGPEPRRLRFTTPAEAMAILGVEG